jgi:DNA-binding response OmpR family regulator
VSVASTARAGLLIVHTDGDVLDQLTQQFERKGFDVRTAATAFQAQGQLETSTAVAVVLAQWDGGTTVGGDIYKWALRHRPALRGQFVFMAAVVPDGFDELVSGRALAIDPRQVGELHRVVAATAAQAEKLNVGDLGDGDWLDTERPTLLLVDDDPVLLTVIASFLGESGFAVTPVDSAPAAMAEMRVADFHVVLADWQMDNGSGNELLRWISEQRPSMMPKLTFLSSTAAGEQQAAAKGCRAFSKGQDSRVLIGALQEIARS